MKLLNVFYSLCNSFFQIFKVIFYERYKDKDEILSTENFSRPDPHPLDFDWRFSSATTKKIVTRLHSESRVLLMGTPSVAKCFNATRRYSKKGFLLVDRQPLLDFPNQVMIDIGTQSPSNFNFDSVVVDAPWYLPEFKRWISWACQSINDNSIIYSSIWPESTRPSAKEERDEIFSWLKNWSDFALEKGFFEYDKPHFEEVAELNNPRFIKEKEWESGDLLIIKPFNKIALGPPLKRENHWARYIIGTMQLAVRLDSEVNEIPNLDYVEGNSWIWPHISRRAKGRCDIGFWSSDNLAAKLRGSTKLILMLDTYLGISISSLQDIEPNVFNHFRDFFKSWNIPENCPGKVKKWTHLE